MHHSSPITRYSSLAAVLLVTLCAAACAASPIEIVTATFFGTAEDDDLQGACAAPDGTIYLVGNTGAAAKDLPGGVAPATMGSAVKEPNCGYGFVAQLSSDGQKILRYAQLAQGVA
ncbi:MAG: hypothetical protein NTW87_33980, partial [Planctomycetota bacterium]|nr:hypothetical protein [Planctomycetota bacterium]